MIGYFAQSKKGHDKGATYIIISKDAKYAYVADGRNKLVAAPKKKAFKHIVVYTNCENQELVEIRSKLLANETVYDHNIKRAIKLFLKQDYAEVENV